MHRLTATDTPMVRYTRTIFPSYALLCNFYIFLIVIFIVLIIEISFNFVIDLNHNRRFLWITVY